MIEAFIFDIGNVLLRFDFSLAMKRLEKDCEGNLEEVMPLIEPVKAEYESGKISRNEFQEKVKAIIRYTGADPELVAAWEEIFTENLPMTDLVKRLHGKLPIYLLSNTSDLHMDYIFRTYPVFRLFTDAVYSYAVRCAKPDRRIFEIAIAQFGVRPERTIYIDDLEANVAAARAAGLRAILYDPDDHSGFERVLTEFTELKNL